MSPEQSRQLREVGYVTRRFAVLAAAGAWAVGGLVQISLGAYWNYHGSNNKDFYVVDTPRYDHYAAMQSNGKDTVEDGILNLGGGALLGVGGGYIWARMPARGRKAPGVPSVTSTCVPLLAAEES